MTFNEQVCAYLKANDHQAIVRLVQSVADENRNAAKQPGLPSLPDVVSSITAGFRPPDPAAQAIEVITMLEQEVSSFDATSPLNELATVVTFACQRGTMFTMALHAPTRPVISISMKKGPAVTLVTEADSTEAIVFHSEEVEPKYRSPRWNGGGIKPHVFYQALKLALFGMHAQAVIKELVAHERFTKLPKAMPFGLSFGRVDLLPDLPLPAGIDLREPLRD